MLWSAVMKISFIGQIHIFGEDAISRRLRALSSELTQRRHTVRLYSATERSIRQWQGANVLYRPSFNPTQPGGWLYAAISAISSAFWKADVIHLMGWKVAAFAPVIALLSSESTLIWTISNVSRKTFVTRLIMWQAVRLCDAITVPDRSVQWQLRREYGVLGTYVPDGYSAPALEDIPAKTWKLRKGQYTVVLADSTAKLRAIVKSYTQVKSKKKLVFITDKKTAAMTRLERSSRLLKVVEVQSNRERSSLVRQAASVIIADERAAELMLLACDSEVPVVAENLPRLQEIAGTTVSFFRLKDVEHLEDLLREVVKQPYMIDIQPAQKRARKHFGWARIFEEYETLYHYPVVRRVSVDSIQPKSFTQPVVQ